MHTRSPINALLHVSALQGHNGAVHVATTRFQHLLRPKPTHFTTHLGNVCDTLLLKCNYYCELQNAG
jgi:hypothetical protein